MFLNGGELGGFRLLDEEIVAAATTAAPGSEHGDAGQAYGYGWFVFPDGSYGHGGSDGTYAWIDPAREIIGLVFTQSPGGRIPWEQFRRVVEASIGDE